VLDGDPLPIAHTYQLGLPQPQPAPAQRILIGRDGKSRKVLAAGMLRSGKKYQSILKIIPQADRELTQRKFMTAAQKEFQAQESEIIAALNSSEELRALAGAKLLRKDAAPADEPDSAVDEAEIAAIVAGLAKWEDFNTRFQEKMQTPYKGAIKRGGDLAMRGLEVDTEFDPDSDDVQAWLTDYLPRLGNQVTGTTQSQITAALVAGIAGGLGVAALADKLRGIFSTAKNDRAESIGINESTRGLHEGEVEAWKQSGIVIAKQWILGPNPCDWCLEMADRTMELTQDFYSIGELMTSITGEPIEVDYADVEFPPLHDHCQCDVAPVLLAEGESI
jgi:hypothetical protein